MTQQSSCNNVTDIRRMQVTLWCHIWKRVTFWKVWTRKVSEDGLTSDECQADLLSLCFCAIKISRHLVHISTLSFLYVGKVTLLERQHHLYAYAHQTNECRFSPVGQSLLISRNQMKMGTERRIYSVTLTKTKNLRCIIRLQSRLQAEICQLAN